MNNLRQFWLGKSDYLLILGLIMAGILAWLMSTFTASTADSFLIKTNINGLESSQTVMLDSDKTMLVKGRIGEMLLEFNKNKGVRVASSTCPCQICVNSGWSRSETLICVPNAVVIQPKLIAKNSDEADAVTR